ncbi:Monoacylglycerol lipase [bacterium HR40]|nr:Monoacylglycerol lipase [bacterium HR40]
MKPRQAAALVLVLAACALTAGDERTAPRPAATPPLPTSLWAPPAEPRAAILALHGFNDYRRAFELFGSFAAERGIAVEAFDQRGFGENPDRGRWPGSARLVADARARLLALHRQYPGVPVYLLGVSMGAAVAALAVAEQPPPFLAGVILSAPAVWGGQAMNPFYRGLLWIAARLFPDLELTGESLKRQASDNLEVLRALAADPLFIKRTRIAAIEGLVRLMGEAFAAAPRILSPVLVLVGERDQIVPVDAQLAFARAIGSEDCTLVVYPEGWHLLLRDRQRERVWRDIEAWLFGEPLPSGLARPCAERDLAAAGSGREIDGAPRLPARTP